MSRHRYPLEMDDDEKTLPADKVSLKLLFFFFFFFASSVETMSLHLRFYFHCLSSMPMINCFPVNYILSQIICRKKLLLSFHIYAQGSLV
ncbi:hypothetical protein ACE6H2_026734 [Prunus campanulata]